MRADRAPLWPGAMLWLVIGLVAAGPAAAQVLAGGDSDTLGFFPPVTDLASYGEATYEDEERRDPFLPLIGRRSGPAGGPRFEQLRLTGVFLGSADRSLAVLEDPSHRGYFVRMGEEVGNARLVDLSADVAVFEVRDYGGTRRAHLTLDRDPRASRRPPSAAGPAGSVTPAPIESPVADEPPPQAPVAEAREVSP